MPVSRRTRPSLLHTLIGVFTCVTLLFSIASPAATNAENKLWITDGNVYSIAQSSNTLYIGGDFLHVGANVGRAISLIGGANNADYTFPHFRGGAVYAIVSDGDGGWYIGGDFTYVTADATLDLARLVHVHADRTVDTAFAPNPNGAVYALAYDPTRAVLYVGGAFTQIKETARNYLAALAPTDAALSARWQPEPNAAVRALGVASDGSTVVVGGDFTIIGGAAHDYFTALTNTADTGTVKAAWAAMTADNKVRALLRSIDGTKFFVGGDFTTMGGVGCARLCEVTLATASVNASFLPDVNGSVRALAATLPTATATAYDMLYVGGDFTQVGVTAIDYLARFDLNNAGYPFDSSWDVTPNGAVHALTATTSGSAPKRVYVGGDFDHIGSNNAERHRLAAFDTTASATKTTVDSFAPYGDGTVEVLASTNDGNTVVVGGQFNTLSMVAHARLAALSAASGSVDTTWKPNIADGAVRALAVTGDGSAVYVGGSFTSVDVVNGATTTPTPRKRLARYRASDALLFDWAPSLDAGTVESMVLERRGATLQTLVAHPSNGQVLYAGTSDNLYRSTDTGATWSVVDVGVTNPDVRALAFDPNDASTLYLGTWGNGVRRSTDGGTTWADFNDGSDSLNVFAIGITSSPHVLLLGTQFIQSKASGFLKRADSDTAWTLLQGAEAHVIRIDPFHPSIAYLGSSTGVVRYDVTLGDAGFSDVGQGLKERDITDIVISNLTMNNGDPVMFCSAGAVVYKSIRADLKDSEGHVITDGQGNTTPTTAWELIRGSGSGELPSSLVTSIALDPDDPSTILAATSTQGVYRTRNTGSSWSAVNTGIGIPAAFALLKLPGVADAYFVGTSLGFVYKTTNAGTAWSESHSGIPTDTLYVAGDFTGAHPDYVAAITSSTTGSSYFGTWDALSDGAVRSLALSADGATLYAGGAFANIGGSARAKVAALDTSTAQATSWSPSVDNGEVRAVALNEAETTLYVGGTFTSVASTARNRVAALATADGALTSWDPDSDGAVNVLSVVDNDNLVLVGGAFANIGGAARDNLAMLKTRANTSNASTWAPDPDGTITGHHAFFVDKHPTNFTLYAGGSFTNIGGTGSPHIASFEFKLPATLARPYPQAYNTPQLITLGCDNSGTNPICTQIYFATVSDPTPTDFTAYLDINGDAVNPTISTTSTLTVYGETDESIRSDDATYTYSIDTSAPTTTLNIPGGTYSATQVIHFTCADSSGAGCYATFYTLDGSQPAWHETSSTTAEHEYEPIGSTRIYHHIVAQDQKKDYVAIRIDGDLRYASVDKAGNAGAIATEHYTIKRVPDSGAVDWIELGILLLATARLRTRGKSRRDHSGK